MQLTDNVSDAPQVQHRLPLQRRSVIEVDTARGGHDERNQLPDTLSPFGAFCLFTIRRRFVPEARIEIGKSTPEQLLTTRFSRSNGSRGLAHEHGPQPVRIDRSVRQEQSAPLSLQHHAVDPVEDEAGCLAVLTCEQAGSVEVFPGNLEGLRA